MDFLWCSNLIYLNLHINFIVIFNIICFVMIIGSHGYSSWLIKHIWISPRCRLNPFEPLLGNIFGGIVSCVSLETMVDSLCIFCIQPSCMLASTDVKQNDEYFTRKSIYSVSIVYFFICSSCRSWVIFHACFFVLITVPILGSTNKKFSIWIIVKTEKLYCTNTYKFIYF